MKKILTALALAGICLSCNKSVNTPEQAQISQTKTTSSVSAPLEKKFVVNGQDIILKLVMEPAVVCYSYRNGETPKPCDIFVEFTFTLSQPVNGYVSVDIQKNNMMESTNPQSSGSESGARLVLSIAPNTVKFIYRSSFTNNNNVMVAENNFSIANVHYYQFVN